MPLTRRTSLALEDDGERQFASVTPAAGAWSVAGRWSLQRLPRPTPRMKSASCSAGTPGLTAHLPGDGGWRIAASRLECTPPARRLPSLAGRHSLLARIADSTHPQFRQRHADSSPHGSHSPRGRRISTLCGRASRLRSASTNNPHGRGPSATLRSTPSGTSCTLNSRRQSSDAAASGGSPRCARGVHHREQRRPVDLGGAPQRLGPRVLQPRTPRRDQHEPAFVQPPPARAPEHLQQFLGQQVPLEMPHVVARVGDEHRAHGKIHARREARRGDRPRGADPLCQGFDQPGPRGVAQAAVVVRHAAAQQLGQLLARQRALLRAKARADRPRAARRRGRARGPPPPAGAGRTRGSARGRRAAPWRRGAANTRCRVPPTLRTFTWKGSASSTASSSGTGRSAWATSSTSRPSRRSHAATSPGLPTLPLSSRSCVPGGREGEGEFVVGAPVRVAEHLVFVDDEQARAASAQRACRAGFRAWRRRRGRRGVR